MFADRRAALGMLHASLRFLAADPAEMAVAAQAECLQELERADAMSTAVRARILGAFTASRGYCEDADYSPASWLMHRTRVTKHAARAHVGWARRAAAQSPHACQPLASPTVPGEPVPPAAVVPTGLLSRQALQQAIIGKAVDLVSGPGGLASFLRARELGAPLAGPSLPLDIGFSETIPPGIRNAVIWRDRHCRWAGGCDQPASACEVHHVRHKANGGKTSTKDCVLLCTYHHQVVIHRWGWTLVLNPDGTTTAWNKDKTKVLHSHGPPARAS